MGDIEDTAADLTEKQLGDLLALNRALKRATRSGLLDALTAECESPDAINDVCDAVEYLVDVYVEDVYVEEADSDDSEYE